MTSEQLLEKLKVFYQSVYDLEENHKVGEWIFPLYGRFRTEQSRYLLSKERKLWEADGNEYVFFHICQTLNESDGQQIDRLLREYIEPCYVRGGKETPPPNHMYSYITLILITEEKIGENMKDFVKKYKYHRNYRLSLRGYMETRILLLSVGENGVISNRDGEELVPVLKRLLTE